MSVGSDLDRAYDHCQQVTRSSASNFYYAFRTLPTRKRRAIYAAYAFCRLCDDIADGDLPPDEKRRLFTQTRRQLRESDNGGTSNPLFLALNDASAAFDIPLVLFEEVIRGVEMDLTRSSYDTFAELRDYCYKVASVVGLICIQVFGYDRPSAKHHAIDMGLAMQLTNILRDLKEDADRGRIYIPADEMASFGYTERDLRNGLVNDAFISMMEFQVARARGYFVDSARLIPLLPAQSRACPAVLHATYSTILDRIEASGYDVFQRRIGLSTTEKLLMVTKLWATSLIASTRPERG